MSDLIDIVCVRVVAALEEFASTGTVPSMLLNHSVTVDQIEGCAKHLSRSQRKIAKAVVEKYLDHMRNNLAVIKTRLRTDYTLTLENLHTQDAQFQFPTVLSRYRSSINPVTALYYDAREMVRSYNIDDERHVWLLGLLSDSQFNNQILDALNTDMCSLEKIIKDYHWILRKLDSKVPLELFHAKQIIKDFSQHYVLFAGIPSWEPHE